MFARQYHNAKSSEEFFDSLSDLCNYMDKDFYEEHKTIKFDTLSSFGEYEVVAVFKFNSFMAEVHSKQLHDTGVDTEYGDQLSTLSNCEYTYNNGHFVGVAKRGED